MKLKITKIVFLVVCIAAFLFLLLPYLKTTPPPTPAQLKTQPQVVTDNPLAAVAKRLAHLFRPRGERNVRKMVGSNVPQNDLLAAWNNPQFDEQQDPENADLTSSGDSLYQNEEDDFLPDGNEPWVLVQQVSPGASQPGMHEVNVHENPYDRYIKQERALQAVGSSFQHTHAEIPDSKWARFIRPVKKFFGLDTPTPVGNSPVNIYTQADHAYRLSGTPRSAADPKQPGIGPERLPFPDITPQQWAQMTPFERERKAKDRFDELVRGTRGLTEAAEILASAKYPATKSNGQAQEKQAYEQGLNQQNQERIKQGMLQAMRQRAMGREPVDELSYTLGCKSTSLPDTSGTCMLSPDGETLPDPATPQGMIAREQVANALTFYETTRFAFPQGLPVTPVLGPTTLETISMMEGGPTQNVQQTAQIYQFLFEQQHCAEQTCYWVANTKQSDSQLSNALTMANTTPKFDPLNVYAPFKESFVQWQMKQLGENATEEQREQARKEAEKQFEQNAPNFVPYTVEQARQAKEDTTYYVTDPPQGERFATDIDSVAFVLGNDPLTDVSSDIEAGRLITQSFAQTIKDAQKVIRDTKRPLYQQSVQENMRNELNKKAGPEKPNQAGWENAFERVQPAENKTANPNGKK